MIPSSFLLNNSDLNYYDNNSEKELINEQLKEELRDPQELKGLYYIVYCLY